MLFKKLGGKSWQQSKYNTCYDGQKYIHILKEEVFKGCTGAIQIDSNKIEVWISVNQCHSEWKIHKNQQEFIAQPYSLGIQKLYLQKPASRNPTKKSQCEVDALAKV